MSFFGSSKKWATYESGDFTFLDQNFYHQKFFNYDVRLWANKAKIEIEEGLTRSNIKQVSSSGEVKVEIPFQGSDRSVFTKLTTDGKINLSYDNGLIDVNNGLKLNLYTAYQNNRTFTDTIWKVGAGLSKDNFNYSVRLRYGIKDNRFLIHTKGAHNCSWDNKVWRFNFYNLFDPTIRKVIKNGLLFGLFAQNETKDQFYLRVQSGKRKQQGIKISQLARDIIFNWVRRVSPNTKLALQTNVRTSNEGAVWEGFTVGGEWSFPDSNVTLKAKVSSDLTHAVSITHLLGKYGTYSFGVQVSDVINQKNFTFGSQISLNL